MNFKVTPENFIAEWTKALRSGEYKKGRGYLRTNNEDGTQSYCCLGVLCEIAGLNRDEDERHPHYRIDGISASSTRLPTYLANYLGLGPNTDGIFKEQTEFSGEKYDSLMSINDETTATFSDIADIIEREWAKGNFRNY